MKIYGSLKTTLLDYPGHVAVTLFTGACNFRCPFCHNSDLVLNPLEVPNVSEEYALRVLRKRSLLWDGVCITGGEPTLTPDLKVFLKELKKLNYSVKLDTNGYRYEILEELISEKLVDYVAMDIKNSPDKYMETCGLTSMDFSNIEKSVALLLQNKIPYEFRTTVVRELHEKNDFEAIGKWIKGTRAYYLQSYRESDGVMKKGFSPYSKAELEEMKEILLPYIPNVELRGID